MLEKSDDRELAPTVDDRWLNVQIDRLRRAIDRNKRMVPRLLEAVYGSTRKLAGGGRTGEEGTEKKDTVQSQEVIQNE